MRHIPHVRTLLVVGALALATHLSLSYYGTVLEQRYTSLKSPTTYDRTGAVVDTKDNAQGHLALGASDYPQRLKELVLAKEDQWFYYHPGFHPYRIGRALVLSLVGKDVGGASTITEQLARTLLSHTTERTYAHKLQEMFAAVALEYTLSKDTILNHYLNSAYLGARAQGFGAASLRYFDKGINDLSESELLALVATLSNPARLHPYTSANQEAATALADAAGTPPPLPLSNNAPKASAGSRFELASMGIDCTGECHTTLDNDLTERLRGLLARHIQEDTRNGMTHGAIVVIKLPENELLAVVGSPDPYSERPGTSINMALETRPIGSTIKPFIYLVGFEKGLRPYTKVDDRELKYAVSGGASIYPRNYDGQYRGTVLLDEALQNSLNVPTVEVLRYVTLPTFYEYLTHTLHVVPPQPLHTYAYGIALGGLELDLMTLTHLFTALPKGGVLDPLLLRTDTDRTYQPPSSSLTETMRIADPGYVALVNAILSDRSGAVDQFGAAGSLFLTQGGYAVKTGTSRDYHDSWTVGYTPEFVVGVWVGNVENRPMAEVSGSAGAGALWHDSMELLFGSPYYSGKRLDVGELAPVVSERGYSVGLPNEDPSKHRDLLTRTNLILSPHEGDEYLYTATMQVSLLSTEPVMWSGTAASYIHDEHFSPPGPGVYTLTARRTLGTDETVTITVRSEPGPDVPALP